MHDTFPNPRRGNVFNKFIYVIIRRLIDEWLRYLIKFIFILVIKAPPYCVKESGYGSFNILIEIYFNGTDEIYTLDYYLELQPLVGPKSFSRLRKVIITFSNPNPELRKVLLSGGGNIIKTNDINSSASCNGELSTTVTDNNILNSSNSNSNSNNNSNSNTKQSSTSSLKEDLSFSDVFGQSINKNNLEKIKKKKVFIYTFFK